MWGLPGRLGNLRLSCQVLGLEGNVAHNLVTSLQDTGDLVGAGNVVRSWLQARKVADKMVMGRQGRPRMVVGMQCRTKVGDTGMVVRSWPHAWIVADKM
jgi:hypothetical protein